jgi:hypothetical protein
VKDEGRLYTAKDIPCGECAAPMGESCTGTRFCGERIRATVEMARRDAGVEGSSQGHRGLLSLRMVQRPPVRLHERQPPLPEARRQGAAVPAGHRSGHPVLRYAQQHRSWHSLKEHP